MAWLGRLLYNFRAHDDGLWVNDATLKEIPSTIEVKSSDFTHNAPLPASSAGLRIGGDNTSPQLEWSNLPEGTQEVVMVLQDPDAPVPFVIMHTVVLGIIPGKVASFPAGQLTIPKDTPSSAHGTPHADGWKFGKGIAGRRGYHGPGAPRGHGAHRYFFCFFALREKLPEEAGNWKEAQLLAHIRPLALAKGEIVGTFERS